MAETAACLEGVSKRYQLGARSLREVVPTPRAWPKRPPQAGNGVGPRYIWALNDISFSLHRGEALGIIGPNGAGKSTLLKLLAGVTSPTKGQVNISGRVCPLIEVGAGFHPDLTGRENIYLNGAILGLSRREIQRKFDEIVEFSGLADFLDTPVKRYSSGMYMRLGFSVSAHVEPDLLLVDEVLAVGDYAFQRKCLGWMEKYRRSGTVVFVSHNLEAVARYCTRVVYLHEGRIVQDGRPEEVVAAYLEAQSSQQCRERSPRDLLHVGLEPRLASKQAEIIQVDISNGRGESVRSLRAGEPMAVRMRVRFKEAVHSPHFCYALRRGGYLLAFETNTGALGLSTPDFRAEDEAEVVINHGAWLVGGNYSVSVGVADAGMRFFLDQRENTLMLSVVDKGGCQGIAGLFPLIWVNGQRLEPREGGVDGVYG